MRNAWLALFVAGCGAPSLNELLPPPADAAMSATPSGDMSAPGSEDLGGTTPTSGDMRSAAGDLAHRGGCRLTDIAGGAAPDFVALADFDGDSRLDLVVVNESGTAADGVVRVVLGNGDGSFAGPRDYAGGVDLAGLAVGDFNGDHHADLVVTLWATNSVAIYLGKGDGTFGPPLSTKTGLSNASRLAVGDFNGDGKSDVAVASNGYDAVAILLGKGDGTFSAQAPIHFGEGYQAWSLAVGDFNNDKKADLVVALAGANSQPWSEAILLGRGDGTFDEKSRYEIFASEPRFVAVTDLNRDGNADLVVAYDRVAIGLVGTALGNGDGTFKAVGMFGPNAAPGDLVVGDFDGDHRADVAVSTGSTLQLYRGGGDGTLATPVVRNASGPAMGVAAGDLDGDGVADLVVGAWTTGKVTLMLGGCE